MDYFLGTEGFSYENWRGLFYPDGLSQEDFLTFYGKVFNSVEINSTFYDLPLATTVERWRDAVSGEFLFAAKFPQQVSHSGNIDLTVETAVEFVSLMKKLGSKLGPLLLQFSPAFDRTKQKQLFDLLENLPKGCRYAVELRNASWFEGSTQGELLTFLKKRGIALCVTDHWAVPRTVFVTTDFVYVRWQGDSAEVDRTGEFPNRKRELKEWADTIKSLSGSVERVFCFMNDVYAGHAPAGVNYLKRCLGLEIVNPKSFWPPIPDMFR